MKKTVLALGIAGTLTLSGLSQAGTLSNADKDFLFGSQSVQAKTISIEEMKGTTGEWVWFAVPLILSIGKYSWDVATGRRDFSYAGLGWSIISAIPVIRGGYIANQVSSNLLKTYYLTTGGMTSYIIGSNNPF